MLDSKTICRLGILFRYCPSYQNFSRPTKNTRTTPRKTWGFRRSTLAKRDASHEVEAQSDKQDDGLSKARESSATQSRMQAAPRRSGRATKRTPQLQAFLSTHIRLRKPLSPGDSGGDSPGSMERVTACSPNSSGSLSPAERERDSDSDRESSDDGSSGGSSGNEDEISLKELQRRLRNKKVQSLHLPKVVCQKADFLSGRNEPPKCTMASVRLVDVVKWEPVEESMVVQPLLVDDPCAGVDVSDSTDFGEQGPGDFHFVSIYCILMVQISCSRCSEWFHGSCVGISIPRAEVMRDSGEVYVCPNCSALEDKMEAKEESSLPTINEEHCCIKGRIQMGASSADSKENPSASAANQKCVVDGCDKGAQPGSVYCSSECILKHAAAALQTLKKDDDVKKSKKKEVVKKKKKKVKFELTPKSMKELKLAAVKANLKRSSLLVKAPSEWYCVEYPSLFIFLFLLQSRILLSYCKKESIDTWRSDEVFNLSKPISISGSKEKSELKKEVPLPGGTQAPSSPPKAHPTVEQIRHNVRRTLKDILTKRCNDSDDIFVGDEELRKVATHIEKELFVLCQTTDSKYKSKVRSLILNLKDPKNQGLFRRVIRGDLSASRLVRLGPQEMASRELAVWRERENSKACFSIFLSIFTHYCFVSLDGEESFQEEKSEVVQRDFLSSMLNDTTDQHKAHLFDLNCKICTDCHPTGRMVIASEDPPPAKKAKPASSSSSAASGSFTKKSDTTLMPPPPAPLPPTPAPAPTPVSISAPFSVTPPVQALRPVSSVERTRADPRLERYASQAAAALPSSAEPAPPKPPTTIGATEPSSFILHPMMVPQSPSLDFMTEMPAAHVTHSPGQPVFTSLSPQQPVLTLQALSHLESLWKGFVNMHGVAKVVMKAYPVSGSMTSELPDTIHIGGRILPKMVWDYVGKLKTSGSKVIENVLKG
uniref:TFIIS central domain-containing protein n=1 Tax=Eptatretus burgeri TaxID=7764 RepID=A0A8C4Q8W9_EPTBU